MEPSDTRATDHLIAERTIAVSGQTPVGERSTLRRLRLLGGAVTASFLALGGVSVMKVVQQGGQPTPEVGMESLRGGPLGADSDAASASLNVNAWPTATIYLDGRRLNQSTPVNQLRLPAGPHTLVLISKDGALRKEFNLTFQTGETRTLAVALDR